MSTSKYEWYRNAAGEYAWRLKAPNGEIVSSGEGYKTKGGVFRGIAAHRRIAATLKVVEAKA